MDFEHTQTLEWLETRPKENKSSQNEREDKQLINQMLNFLDMY